jgi:predicted nucleotidyltransferase
VVTEAASAWLRTLATEGRIVAGGYFGSYARGDAGVGSDLDIVLVIPATRAGFEHRSVAFDATGLPVPADVLVYTESEIRSLLNKQHRFSETLRTEAVWEVPLPEAGDEASPGPR